MEAMYIDTSGVDAGYLLKKLSEQVCKHCGIPQHVFESGTATAADYAATRRIMSTPPAYAYRGSRTCDPFPRTSPVYHNGQLIGHMSIPL